MTVGTLRRALRRRLQVSWQLQIVSIHGRTVVSQFRSTTRLAAASGNHEDTGFTRGDGADSRPAANDDTERKPKDGGNEEGP